MTVGETNESRPRLKREDWERAALDAIGEEGLAAAAVEPLARRLGVTKGSFYAHFSSRDELIDAALARWERAQGLETLERFARIEDPAERLGELLLTAATFSQSGEPSVHANLIGELHNPRVRAAVQRVTHARLELLTSAYRELGLAPPRAADRARLAYAAYVGLMQLARESPERRVDVREMKRFVDELRVALVGSATP
jgi:AcrR family transcriptional regulator